MANKIKKLCKKAKKGLKNIVPRKAKSQKTKPKPLHSIKQPLKSLKPAIEEKISEVEGIKKDKKRFKWAKKSFKTKPVEKKGNIFKNGFKKLKGKIKKLNPIKSKKNKIIGSKKLAFLLTAGTIVAILPIFNLTPFPALAITSACVFSINFIAVKTLKKVVKQCKAKSKALADSEKPQEEIQDVSIESVKKDSEQISRERDF
ncbi:MAG: hypothetical protein LBU56_01940 [Rickettsiales bacterium]|jgi:hypothetical protein|nr:hypothetical protein [Rickettsiales bacterium]